MACADVEMDIDEAEEVLRKPGQGEPTTIRYEASELLPDPESPLHDLLQKQPAVLGSIQVATGFLSVAVGFLLAVTQGMTQSLFTLFRVSQMTGSLFIIAGALSNLLFKYPGLLPVSLIMNHGCIIAAVIAACLISIDLAHWNQESEQYLRVEALELCVLAIEIFISAVLCFWFSKEKGAKFP